MKNLLITVGTIMGSGIGWWAGNFYSIGTALMLSLVGGFIGVMLGAYVAKRYL